MVAIVEIRFGPALTGGLLSSGDTACIGMFLCGFGAIMGGGLPFAIEGFRATVGLLGRLFSLPPGCCSNSFTRDVVGAIEVESVGPSE